MFQYCLILPKHKLDPNPNHYNCNNDNNIKNDNNMMCGKFQTVMVSSGSPSIMYHWGLLKRHLLGQNQYPRMLMVL